MPWKLVRLPLWMPKTNNCRNQQYFECFILCLLNNFVMVMKLLCWAHVTGLVSFWKPAFIVILILYDLVFQLNISSATVATFHGSGWQISNLSAGVKFCRDSLGLHKKYLKWIVFDCYSTTNRGCVSDHNVESRTTLATFSSYDYELRPMTLALELHNVQMNRYTGYPGQKSFRSKIIILADKQACTLIALPNVRTDNKIFTLKYALFQTKNI